MLKIKIIVVDRTRSSFLSQGEIFYLDRLRKYANMEWVEVKKARIHRSMPVEEVLAIEGAAIQKKLQQGDFRVALDSKGSHCSSIGLAEWIRQLMLKSAVPAFIIGGPLGLSKKILDSSEKIFSLSRLTLTHEMSRLILLEQLYRAFTIINNEKYHK
ncbi:MAG: 23S rRNA (pseudouridine(1915)-N(3))-methyltransferase RlmH [Deltaproteobacteria bacterium]|nr:23S rRNA (pseudouridine(1915)-N(3))-methyltransferase RlmH [Deltaproteobacteria bacterium]